MRLQGLRGMAVAGALIATLASTGAAAHNHGGSDEHGDMRGAQDGGGMAGDRSSMEAPVGMPGPGMMRAAPGMMGSMGAMTPYMTVMLGLSEQQMDQVHQIRDDRMGDYWNLMRQMNGSMQGLMSVWSQPNPDPSEVGAMYAQVSEVKRKMLELRTEMRRAVRDVLTAEQRERLDQMRRTHKPSR